MGSDPVKCTYCGGTRFHKGPSGGISQNILCANTNCRHWFNYSQGIVPLEDLHRVEPTADQRAIEIAERDRAEDEVNQEFATCYREGRSVRELFLPYRSYTYPQKGFIQSLMGFMDAMASDTHSKDSK